MQEVHAMIVFDKLWKLMSQKGVSTYTLREKYGIDGKTISRLKNNKNTETKTLNKAVRRAELQAGGYCGVC